MLLGTGRQAPRIWRLGWAPPGASPGRPAWGPAGSSVRRTLPPRLSATILRQHIACPGIASSSSSSSHRGDRQPKAGTSHAGATGGAPGSGAVTMAAAAGAGKAMATSNEGALVSDFAVYTVRDTANLDVKCVGVQCAVPCHPNPAMRHSQLSLTTLPSGTADVQHRQLSRCVWSGA